MHVGRKYGVGEGSQHTSSYSLVIFMEWLYKALVRIREKKLIISGGRLWKRGKLPERAGSYQKAINCAHLAVDLMVEKLDVCAGWRVAYCCQYEAECNCAWSCV